MTRLFLPIKTPDFTPPNQSISAASKRRKLSRLSRRPAVCRRGADGWQEVRTARCVAPCHHQGQVIRAGDKSTACRPGPVRGSRAARWRHRTDAWRPTVARRATGPICHGAPAAPVMFRGRCRAARVHGQTGGRRTGGSAAVRRPQWRACRPRRSLVNTTKRRR